MSGKLTILNCDQIYLLEEPRVINDVHIVIQVLITGLIVIFSCFGLWWVAGAYMSSVLVFSHYLVGAICIAGLIYMAYEYSRCKRWVSYAANQDGVFLNNRCHEFIFFSWADVGNIEIGVTSSGDASGKGLYFEVRLGEEERRELFKGDVSLAMSMPNEKGYYRVLYKNSYRPLHKTIKQLEELRKIWEGGLGNRSSS